MGDPRRTVTEIMISILRRKARPLGRAVLCWHRRSPLRPSLLSPSLLVLLLLAACPMQVDDPGGASPGPAAPGASSPGAPSINGQGGPNSGNSLETPPPGAPPDPNADGGAAPGTGPGPGQGGGPGDGVPIRIDVQPPDEDEPAWTQARLKSADHVSFSGTVRCEACVASLVLRALPFQPPDELRLGAPPSPLTTLKLADQGAFTLLVPRGTAPVVLELLVDLDNDGRPDRGERMSVVVRDGQLVPDRDREGLLIDATESESGPWPAMAPDIAGGGD